MKIGKISTFVFVVFLYYSTANGGLPGGSGTTIVRNLNEMNDYWLLKEGRATWLC
jgi:hypothetical protein